MNINTTYDLIFVICQYLLVIVGCYLVICGLLFNINFLKPLLKKQRYIYEKEAEDKRKELEEC